MSAEQDLSASQILAKATEDVNKSVLVLQEAGQLLVEKAGEFAVHPNTLATAQVAGHIKLGTGFERQPDGTVNVVGGGGSANPPDLSNYYTKQEADTALTAHKNDVTAGMAAHEDAVDVALATHKTEVDTALATHKTDVTAAEEAHKTEVDTALTAHNATLATAQVAGHIKLGTGFEHLPDGTVNVVGGGSANPPDLVDNATKWAGATRFVSSTAPATTMGVDGDIYMQLLS